jgi:hypothetical protein
VEEREVQRKRWAECRRIHYNSLASSTILHTPQRWALLAEEAWRGVSRAAVQGVL